MTWRQAQQKTLAKWLRIRDSLETPDSLALIARLNEVCALCERANDKASEPGERCKNCIVFADSGGCQDTHFELTEAVLREDWESVKAKVDRVIELVHGAELPGETASPVMAFD